MKAYPIRNAEIFEPEVKEERTNKHRKEKEQECNCTRPYEIVLTEQEWLQTASTEQLAEWIVHLADDCTRRHECNVCNSWFDEMKVLEWLKQPHKRE